MALDEQKLIELKKSYKEKNDWLSLYYERVTAVEMYRGIFPVGSFERAGHYEDARPNGIMTVISKTADSDVPYNLLVFDDLSVLNEAAGLQFVIMSPISYSGRNRNADNARYLHALSIDLDGVELHNLEDIFFQMKNGVIPECTYIVNSGTGVHLYYVLDRPIAMYKNMHERLKLWKYELIAKIWNRYTSIYGERSDVQYQGVFQGFRVPGSLSKLGTEYPVVAFEVGNNVTIDYLNSFIADKSKVLSEAKLKSKLPLAEAKAKYPGWYQHRVVEGAPKGRWTVKRDLYDWWIRKIREGASVGHRYFCLQVLATYAIKCEIEEEELFRDTMALLPYLDSMTKQPTDRFTKEDAMAALTYYQESYVYFSRAEAERVSGIAIPANKRNFQPQKWHLEDARSKKANMKRRGQAFKNPEGRPSAQGTVESYREKCPEGSISDCIEATGLSRSTVYKYWHKDQ